MNKQDLIDFERKIAERFDNGEIPYLIHLSGGNEEQLIEIFKEVQPGDYVFSTHRSHYHYLLAGGSPERLEELILTGKSMFVFDRKLNFYASSIVAGTVSIAAGVAWALKRKGSTQKVWCFVGDGAEDEGHFYEAARYVNSQALPCKFIIEDNDRSVIASKEERWGTESLHTGISLTHASHVGKNGYVRKYRYHSTWPHGGTGSGKWLKFSKEAIVEEQPHPFIPVPKNNTVLGSVTYKDAVCSSMKKLAQEGVIFVGYNVRCGNGYETFGDVPLDQRLETPLAENLMAGLALGMSLEGYRPLLFFERHDFIYNALDILVNQADKAMFLSNGEYEFPIIIKAVVGSVKPFYAGHTHTSDLSELFKKMFTFPVYDPVTPGEVIAAYDFALTSKRPVLISERKGLY